MHEEDIAPPDLSEFEVVRPSIPGAADEQSELTSDKNAYSYFLAAAEALSEDTMASLFPGGKTSRFTDKETATRLVSENERSLDLVQKGTLCDICLFPQRASVLLIGEEEHVRQLFVCLEMLCCLKSQLERKEGQYDAGLMLSQTLLKFGAMIQRYAPSIEDWSIGWNAECDALTEMRWLARAQGVSDCMLFSLAETLSAPNYIDVGFEYAIKSDFILETKTLDTFPELVLKEPLIFGKYSHEQMFGERQTAVSKALTNPMYSLICQPNQTKVLLAELHRELLDGVPLHYAQLSPVVSEPISPLRFSDGSLIGALLRGNILGESILRRTSRFLKLHAARKSVAQANCSGTRLVVACIRYERKNGRLPESLEDLVPEFMDQVPADPFDGKPFRYDEKKKILYSVGADLEVSSATTAPSEQADWRRDLVYPIH